MCICTHDQTHQLYIDLYLYTQYIHIYIYIYKCFISGMGSTIFMIFILIIINIVYHIKIHFMPGIKYKYLCNVLFKYVFINTEYLYTCNIFVHM